MEGRPRLQGQEQLGRELIDLLRPRAKEAAAFKLRDYEQRNITALTGKNAAKLADILDVKLKSKGATLDMPKYPRSNDSWIKVTVQEFDDGPRVDMEGYKPDGNIGSFQRFRIQGNKVGCYGGLLVQVDCSIPMDRIAAAMRQALERASYVAVYNLPDDSGKLPWNPASATKDNGDKGDKK